MKLTDAKHPKYHDYLFTTPIGDALHPHLLMPDDRFDEDGKYKIGIILKPDEIRVAREALTQIYRKAFPDVPGEPHLPIRADGDRSYLTANSSYLPRLWDSERKDCDQPYMVRSGHRIRIAGRARPFRSALATGVALYLSGVEIHEDPKTLEVFRPKGDGPSGVSFTRPVPSEAQRRPDPVRAVPVDDMSDLPF